MKYNHTFKLWINWLLRYNCCVCGTITRKLFCTSCMVSLELNTPNGAMGANNLRELRSLTYIDSITCLYKYREPLIKILQQLKYEQRSIAKALPLGFLLYPTLAKIGKNYDFIIPMPAHPKKYKTRSFNQVDLLLWYYQTKSTSLIKNKINAKIVRKTRNVFSQAKLSHEERLNHQDGAFVVVKPIYNKKILLVDDVITTGYTVDELARVLKNDGAKQVDALALMGTKNRQVKR